MVSWCCRGAVLGRDEEEDKEERDEVGLLSFNHDVGTRGNTSLCSETVQHM